MEVFWVGEANIWFEADFGQENIERSWVQFISECSSKF